MFQKILIANRGEIALRVMRACQELNISSVAIFSEADRQSLHVRLADEAVLVGGPLPLDSYLNIDRILAAAQQVGADAIHPGYGFLSENATFAQRCVEAGLTFIGPPAEAIALAGDKLQARKTMHAAQVPVIPGSLQPINSVEEALAEGTRIGYPVMLKAVGGGGGKGIRIVREAAEMSSAYQLASSEARKAFSNAALYIEKLLERPRHIEIQVLADNHGHILHLGERECSIQRRHQKLLEETPSPFVSEQMRTEMGAAAIRAAQGVGYRNAGTVEFMVDQEGQFYFLEMNTRLQVEHTITELVTGIDIVQEQIRIAAGEALSYRQEDIHLQGHALQARICAENPDADFMPSIGKVRKLHLPSGPKIRMDSALFEGLQVELYYDPLLAKLITWGRNREESRRRMVAALEEFYLEGLFTNAPYLLKVIQTADYIQGHTNTAFLSEHHEELAQLDEQELQVVAIAALLKEINEKQRGMIVAQQEVAHGGLAEGERWLHFGRIRRMRERV